MENLFNKNQIVFVNFNEYKPQVFDLNTDYLKEVVGEIYELYDENEPINIFGNIEGTDFFRTNYPSSYDLLNLIEEDNLKNYCNWEEICDNFQERFENEIFDFEFDGFDLGEMTYYFNPNYIYGDDGELTEEGWNNISENFIEKLHEVVSDFPIKIVSETIEDFDEYEYNDTLRIRFEIRPFVKNSKKL